MWWTLVRLSDHLVFLPLLLIVCLVLGCVISLHPFVPITGTAFLVRVVYLTSIVMAIRVVFVAIALLQDALDHALPLRSFGTIPASRLLLVSA